MKPFAHTAAVVGSRFLLLVFLLLVALAQPARAQVPQQGCGNENETPCPFQPIAHPFNGICDTGLQPSLHTSGCLIPNPFGGCLVPKLSFSCTNLSRRQPTVDPFLGGWADWALKNQRELAQDEPLNWVMHIATHNSYNTFADGHNLVDLPNQIYSTTDQLRLGARAITFDNYFIPDPDLTGAARLCHSAFSTSNPVNLETVAGLCAGQLGNQFYLLPPSLRYYSNGIKEIRNWLDQNPNEIVILDFEEYVPRMNGPDEAVLAPIRAYLGDMVFAPPPDVPPASFTASIKLIPQPDGSNVPQLTVTGLGSGALGRGGLSVDDQITGTGIPPGTVIQSFGTGTGGTGTYNLYKTSVTGSITNGVLTVTALGSSAPGWPIALYVDEQITGTGIPAGTFIQSFGTVTGGTCTPDNSGSTGPFGTGCYVLSKPSLTDVPSETITSALTVPSETITRPVKAGGVQGGFPDRWPTRREMLAAGKRVIILDNAYDDFQFAKQIQSSEFLFSESRTVAGSYGEGSWLALNQRRYDTSPTNPRACFEDPRQGHVSDFDLDFHRTLFTKATIIVEERELGELAGFGQFPGINVPFLPQAMFGLMSDKDIVDATECNYSIITLDKYSQALVPPDGSFPVFPFGHFDYLIYTGVPDFHRQDLAVWSWKEGDRGQNGDCAMLEGSPSLVPVFSLPPLFSQRWVSADCSPNSQVQAKFACARPRSQSGKDPLQWQDPLGDDWRVTTVAGSWEEGTKECLAEFGQDGFVFSVPVNGYQNRRLKDAALYPPVGTATDNIWLNYRQHGDGRWVIPTSPAPVAIAGPNQVVECGNSVKLDAGGSHSPDDLTLSYKWQGPFGIRTTQVVNLATPGDLPFGVDPIGLTVTDSNGQSGTDSLTVTVQDTTPPVIRSAVANPNFSWPPNHKMFPVHLSLDASDACDPNFVCHVVSVTSNEGTPADWQIVGPADVMLRSERSGNGGDRVYTISIECTDASGNTSTRAVTVTIPHDQGK